MRQWIRSHLTYANVMVTILAFVVLGGGTALGAYVVSSNSQVGSNTISGHKPPSGKHANIIAGSVNGTDVANNSLGGRKINEGTLSRVPSAASANSVGGKSASELEGGRAYAVVLGNVCGGSPAFCPLVRNKGVAYAVHVANGRYCVGINGINNADATSLAVVTMLSPGPDTWARWRGPDGNVDCVGSEFEVWTGIAQNPANADFTIVIL